MSMAQVFAALGDANRQAIIERLASRGSASATTLAGSMAVTRQAVDRHLRVLARAGLVSAARQGREVHYAVQRETLSRSAGWLNEVGERWERRLEAIKAAAESGT